MPAATQVPARCPGPMIHHFEGIAAYIILKVILTIMREICADYAAFMWIILGKYTLFRYGGARNGFYFSKIRTKINEFLKYEIIASKWCIMARGGRREACVAGEAARDCKMARDFETRKRSKSYHSYKVLVLSTINPWRKINLLMTLQARRR